MYIGKYWGNFIGGPDDSLNLVAFGEYQKIIDALEVIPNQERTIPMRFRTRHTCSFPLTKKPIRPWQK